MQNTRKISVGLSCLVLAALLSPVLADACSRVFPEVHVGRTFRVRVMDRGRPVHALRLVLSHSGSSNAKYDVDDYAYTDEEGYARFADLYTGSYVLTPDHDGEVADGVLVDVEAVRAGDATIQLTWPNASPLPIRTVSGTLRLPDYYPRQTQSQFSLSLLEGISARVVATTHTDSMGRFTFDGTIPAGIYFLQPNSSEGKSRGEITIEVDPSAEQDALDLDLGWTTCGLVYSQRNKGPEIRASDLCGDVADVIGGAISNADVVLLAMAEDGEILDQARSDANGQFVLREQQEGTYRLLVKRRGFQPFIRVIHAEAGRASDSCERPIHVHLEAL